MTSAGAVQFQRRCCRSWVGLALWDFEVSFGCTPVSCANGILRRVISFVRAHTRSLLEIKSLLSTWLLSLLFDFRRTSPPTHEELSVLLSFFCSIFEGAMHPSRPGKGTREGMLVKVTLESVGGRDSIATPMPAVSKLFTMRGAPETQCVLRMR